MRHPLNLLIRKLDAHCQLDEHSRSLFRSLPYRLRSVDAATYLVREGDPPSACAIIVSGYAYRQKLTDEGRRQIVSLHIPGEPLDFQSLFLELADHNVLALTTMEVAMVPRSEIRKLVADHPGVAAAVFAQNMAEASILRGWLLNVGRRPARERLSHLLCEFACRMDAQGLSDPSGYFLPMTQEQLGDALGLTSVHVNRMLRSLEIDGLIQRTRRNIRFSDREALQSVGGFNPQYLHLGNKVGPI